MTIHKNGDVNDTNNYRGLTLLPTAYKIYAEVIGSHHLIRKTKKNKQKLYALFIDPKKAFVTVNRK